MGSSNGIERDQMVQRLLGKSKYAWLGTPIFIIGIPDFYMTKNSIFK